MIVIPGLTRNPVFSAWFPAGVCPVLVGVTLRADPHRDTMTITDYRNPQINLTFRNCIGINTSETREGDIMRKSLFLPGIISLLILFISSNSFGDGQWMSIGPHVGTVTVHNFFVDPKKPDILYADTSRGSFKSTEGGASWIVMDSPGPILALDPQSPDTIYAGGGGVYKSTDGGENWTSISGNLTAIFGQPSMSVHLIMINPQMPDNIYAAISYIDCYGGKCWGGGGLVKSINGGATWTRIYIGALGGVYINALAINPWAPDTLYAAPFPYQLQYHYWGEGVYKSIDGGESWIPVNTGLTNKKVLSLTVNPQISDIVYAGTDGGGVFKSVDGGANWTDANIGLTNLSVNVIVINPFFQSPDMLYAGTGGGVFKSYNGGASWHSISAGLPDLVVQSLALDPRATAYTVYVGTDGGGVFKKVPVLPVIVDLDGDGKTDNALWRMEDGYWDIFRSSDGGHILTQYGAPGDILVPGDYDGDGKTDIAVWRPSNGIWYIKRSSDGGYIFADHGTSNDIPVPGDYDGDGKTDIAMWKQEDGLWDIIQSSDGGNTLIPYGAPGDIPVPGDYDGDGKTDIAVWRPETGIWYIKSSSNGGYIFAQYGGLVDIPVPGDYDGDGKTDISVWRPVDGVWYIMRSSDGGYTFAQLGTYDDTPVPADYDGDGKTDVAVWSSEYGYRQVIRSSDRTTITVP
jgi:hypothetical protein